MRKLLTFCIILFCPLMVAEAGCGADAKELSFEFERGQYVRISGQWIQYIVQVEDFGDRCKALGRIAVNQGYCHITWQANAMWKTIVCTI